MILLIIAGAFLLPLLWLVFAAFNPEASQAFAVPKHMSVENFRLSNRCQKPEGFLNSLFISVVQTGIVLVCSCWQHIPCQDMLKTGQKITMGMLFLTSIPITAVMVPVYQMFIMMKLVDSLGRHIFLSASGLPYGIWMMKNFLDGVSVDLEEAAWIDGASAVKSMIHVVLPLMLPDYLQLPCSRL